MFYKLPKGGIPRPFAKKPLDRMYFLYFDGHHFKDLSEAWSIPQKLKYEYLSRTIRLRQKLINWQWKWKWRLGLHPAQKVKEDK